MFIDSTLIANQHLYQHVSSVTNCLICEGILVNPLKCSVCGYSFCKRCINIWQKQSSICPIHCTNPKYTPSLYVKKILAKLTFFCESGCLDVIAYNDLEKHSSYQCPNGNLRKASEKASLKLEKEQKENQRLRDISIILREKIVNLSGKTFKKENVIIHRKHPHPLTLCEKKTDWICDSCEEYYNRKIKSCACTECDFDICASCYFSDFANSE